MTVKLGSNIASLNAQRRLTESSVALSGAYERLSSGLRINKASDDSAGLAIATSLKSNARVFTQAIRNVNDGISLLSIAEGALKELSGITTRQLELAEQAANGSYSLEQRQALNTEANALVEEFNRIVNSVEFNDRKLLDNSINDLRIQAGYGTNGGIAFDIGNYLARNIGDGTFKTAVSYAIGVDSYFAASGDFDNDGDIDIVSTSNSTGAIRFSEGNGDGTFQAAQIIGTSSGAFEVKVGDIDNDGNLDIITADNGGDSISVFLGNGDGSFAAALSSSVGGGTFPYSVEVVDLNNDNILDVIAGNPGTGTISVLLGDGDGTFSAAVSYASGTAVNGISSGDLNGDGYVDLISTNYIDDTISIFLGNGTGSFASAQTIATGDAPIAVKTADFNGDGYLDFVTADHDSPSLSVFINNGDGTFETRITIGLAGPVSTVEINDFNGDGYADILSGSDAAGVVSLTYGNGDGTFQAAQSVSSSTAEWGITSGDFNNDGGIDFATSNILTGALNVTIANTEQVTTIGRLNLNTASDARAALTTLNNTLTRITKEIGSVGATYSRLEVAVENLSASRENFYAAAGRIEDVDVAFEAADMIRLTVLQQASTAVLAQANQQPALALKLLEED